MTMNTDTDTQLKKLLSLKKLEQPTGEYFENFVYNFRDYQRQKMLSHKPSLAERLSTWWTENVSLSSIQPTFAGATCAVMLTAGLILTQVQPSTSSAVLAAAGSSDTVSHDSRYADAQSLYSDAISQQAEIYTASANTSDDYASARLVNADAGSNYDNLYFF